MADLDNESNVPINDSEVIDATVTPASKPRAPRKPRTPRKPPVAPEGAQVLEDGATVKLPAPVAEKTSKPVTPTSVVESSRQPTEDEKAEPGFRDRNGTPTTKEPVAEESHDNASDKLKDFFDGAVHDETADAKAQKKLYKRVKKLYKRASNEATYTDNGVIVSPGYFQAWPGRSGRFNVFAWLGIFTAFAFFPAGILFSGLGWVNSKGVPDDRFSKYLSIVGFGISVIFAVFILLALIARIFSGVVSAYTGHWGW